MKDKWCLSQWLLSNVGKNFGRAGVRTHNPWIDNPRRYRLSYLGSARWITPQASVSQSSLLTFSYIQRLFEASAADGFWKHCDKRRNCSKQAISPFATMFSTFFSNYTFIYWYCPSFCLDIFRVVGCRFVVCRKGLKDGIFGILINCTRELFVSYISVNWSNWSLFLMQTHFTFCQNVFNSSKIILSFKDFIHFVFV